MSRNKIILSLICTLNITLFFKERLKRFSLVSRTNVLFLLINFKLIISHMNIIQSLDLYEINCDLSEQVLFQIKYKRFKISLLML